MNAINKTNQAGSVNPVDGTTKRRMLRIILLIAGVCMMAVGIFRGEASEIFRKAVVVCMECIGIG